MKIIFWMLVALPFATMAGEADVIDAKIVPADQNRYDLRVTVRHADEGWEHYADRWEILSPKGEILATRTLYHPHIHEQPFTRGLSAVVIPGDITSITIRAHDKVHGYGGKTFILKLPD